MKKKTLRLISCFLLLVVALAPGLGARQQPAPESSKETKIREILRLTGGANLAAQVMDQLIGVFKKTMPKVPESVWEAFRSEFKAEELEAKIIPIYSRHFEEADLDGLIVFYNSPVGKKLISEQPAVFQESFAVGQQWGQEIAARVLARLKEKAYTVKS